MVRDHRGGKQKLKAEDGNVDLSVGQFETSWTKRKGVQKRGEKKLMTRTGLIPIGETGGPKIGAPGINTRKGKPKGERLAPGNSKIEPNQFQGLVGGCLELVAADRWLKSQAPKTKGKLSSARICANFFEAKNTGNTGILPEI